MRLSFSYSSELYPDGYGSEEYEKDNRMIYIGDFFFWNVRTTKDVDMNDVCTPQRTYREQIYKEEDTNTYWSAVDENAVIVLKCLYHKNFPPPEWVKEGWPTTGLHVKETDVCILNVPTDRNGKVPNIKEEELVDRYTDELLMGAGKRVVPSCYHVERICPNVFLLVGMFFMTTIRRRIVSSRQQSRWR